MTQPTHQLNYELSSEDVKAWQSYVVDHLVLRGPRLGSRVFNVLMVVLGSIIGLAIVGTLRLIVWAVGLAWDPMLYWFYLFGVIAGIGVTYVVFQSRGSVFRRRLAAKLASGETSASDKQLVGHRTLTVSQEGFQLESPNGSTSRKWSIVKEVYTTDEHIFMVADVAVIVPRGAFTSDAQRSEFIATIQGWKQQK